MLKAAIIGNLGGDPELRYTADGRPVLRANVACTGRRRDQQGNWQDETTWVRLTVFGARAEALAGILTKGQRVYAEGRLDARPWTDQQGNVRAGLELTAGEVEFMSARSAEGAGPARRGADDDGDIPF